MTVSNPRGYLSALFPNTTAVGALQGQEPFVLVHWQTSPVVGLDTLRMWLGDTLKGYVAAFEMLPVEERGEAGRTAVEVCRARMARDIEAVVAPPPPASVWAWFRWPWRPAAEFPLRGNRVLGDDPSAWSALARRSTYPTLPCFLWLIMDPAVLPPSVWEAMGQLGETGVLGEVSVLQPSAGPPVPGAPDTLPRSQFRGVLLLVSPETRTALARTIEPQTLVQFCEVRGS